MSYTQILSAPISAILNRITVKDRAFLARQLATLLSSGITLSESLTVLISDTRNTRIKQLLESVLRDVEAGLSFSAALEKHPGLFNSTFIAVTRSGESSGKLEDVLLELADATERDHAIATKIRSAMIYPLFIIVSMIGVTVLMMVRVLPQLKSIFLESGAELPMSTQFLIGLSDFMVKNWMFTIMALVGILVGLRLFSKTPTGIKFVDRLVLHLPGQFAEVLYMSRFTRTMGMLIKSGIPIIQALYNTGDVMANQFYRQTLASAMIQVERGIPLSSPLNSSPLFPKIVGQMTLIGEQTGRLDQIMEKLAGYYEEELDGKIKSLSTLIEPIIIVILGIAVAFLVVSILMPIYNIAQIQ